MRIIMNSTINKFSFKNGRSTTKKTHAWSTWVSLYTKKPTLVLRGFHYKQQNPGLLSVGFTIHHKTQACCAWVSLYTTKPRLVLRVFQHTPQNPSLLCVGFTINHKTQACPVCQSGNSPIANPPRMNVVCPTNPKTDDD